MTGSRDEHMAESQPIMGPEGMPVVQDVGSSVSGTVKQVQRPKSPVPKGRGLPPRTGPSRIPARPTVMKRRSVTPPRSRITLEGEAVKTLQQTQATAIGRRRQG